ncbi:alkaline phosphatase D family protein [Desertihabitans aurantiacus]|uniref:alkaline phosphatase D family protein n=1 Tax=Desertihabitans aurantiacus TaxID=2282477 RepID=UPI000DF82E27|nr:alkaline phosphatase D family protein [Desertihabitans aurantiacus]
MTPTRSPQPTRPEPAGPVLSRRHLLVAGAAAGVAGGAVAVPAVARDRRPVVGPTLPADLFGLGVASGDPWPDGFVLWTRLAPEPKGGDGLAGMPETTVEVGWEVALDPQLATVVRRGTELATSRHAYSVHAEVTGLQPGREYWYRFRAGGELSPVGRAVTAPSPQATSAVAFAFASCQNFIEGYFTAYADMARQDLDLVVHLGDYIYEGGGRNAALNRQHRPARETTTLDDYRQRYGQYKADPHLQAAHALAPWAVAPDDHEVENDWAGDISQPDTEPDQDPAVFRQRRAAAYQAYWENLPLRRTSMPEGPEMSIYRRLTFGRTMQLSMLDTRRFRSETILGGDQAVLDRRWDPRRTMLGVRQEGWLLNGLSTSPARWNVLGNQVFAFEADHLAGPAESYSRGTWDSYAAARQRLFDQLHRRGVDNFVMVTGDAHRSVAADLKLDFTDDSSPTVGAELLGTSITSAGDGVDTDDLGRVWLAENPHMRFHNRQRGYQVVRVDGEKLECEYRVCEAVTVPDAPVRTRSVVTVESGRPGIADVSLS